MSIFIELGKIVAVEIVTVAAAKIVEAIEED